MSVELRVVGLLVNRQGIDAGLNHLFVALGLHRVDFDTDRGKERPDPLGSCGNEVVADQPRGFTGQQQDMTETLCMQNAGILFNLVQGQGPARYLVVYRESAIETAV